MYTLISAIAKPFGSGGRWLSVEIGNMPLSAIYTTYTRTLATLSNPLLEKPVCLDLDNIRQQHGGKSLTFNELLASIGNASLPTTAELPVISTQYAKYKDAILAGYKVTPVHPVFAEDAVLPAADKKWLKITHPRADMAKFHKSCMINVNGYFHYADSDGTASYVVDGMVSQTNSKMNHIGFLNFQHIGDIEYVQIKPEMLYKQHPDDLFKNRCYVDIGKDISKKTVVLVLGGYMHVLDTRTLYRVGDKQVCINMQSLPLLDRYYESRGVLDLSSLQLESTSRNESQISIDNFFSDEVLVRYLTLSQSFFVLIDNPDVFVERAVVHRTKMPGMYISFKEPEFPLILGAGKVTNYWPVYEDGQWSLTCVDSIRKNHSYYTTDPREENSVSDATFPESPGGNSRGIFLMIGSDI